MSEYDVDGMDVDEIKDLPHARGKTMRPAKEKTLRAIGFWRDPKIVDHRYRHPIAFVDPEWDLAERRLVAHYFTLRGAGCSLDGLLLVPVLIAELTKRRWGLGLL